MSHQFWKLLEKELDVAIGISNDRATEVCCSSRVQSILADTFTQIARFPCLMQNGDV